MAPGLTERGKGRQPWGGGEQQPEAPTMVTNYLKNRKDESLGLDYIMKIWGFYWVGLQFENLGDLLKNCMEVLCFHFRKIGNVRFYRRNFKINGAFVVLLESNKI